MLGYKIKIFKNNNSEYAKDMYHKNNLIMFNMKYKLHIFPLFTRTYFI